MTIVKISLHKVRAERKLNAKGGQVRIKNNVTISNIEELQLQIPGKAGLKFTFSFNCKYEPNLGTIDVEGQIYYTGTEVDIKKINDDWTNKKKVPVSIMEQIVNASLHKGNIQAIKISEEVGLPSPLPLPKVKTQPAKKEAPKKAPAKKAAKAE